MLVYFRINNINIIRRQCTISTFPHYSIIHESSDSQIIVVQIIVSKYFRKIKAIVKCDVFYAGRALKYFYLLVFPVPGSGNPDQLTATGLVRTR